MNDGNKNSQDVQNRAINSAPKWALPLCGLLLVFSISLKIAGIDVSRPINKIMDAHAIRIELEAKNLNPTIDSELLSRVGALEGDMVKVKEVVHNPKSVELVFK